MDISVWPFILLFGILVGIQLLMNLLFYFVSYLTGVFILKTLVLLKSQYTYMSYKALKKRYATAPEYKTPIMLGVIVWFGLLFVVTLLD